MKKNNAGESSFTVDFEQENLENEFSELFKENQYHIEEVKYWVTNVILETQELARSIEKLKHHLSQIL